LEQTLLTRLEAQPNDGSPTMRRVFRALAEDAAGVDLTSAFDGGLDILIKGIEAIADDRAVRKQAG
jgi:hypothetical protein